MNLSLRKALCIFLAVTIVSIAWALVGLIQNLITDKSPLFHFIDGLKNATLIAAAFIYSKISQRFDGFNLKYVGRLDFNSETMIITVVIFLLYQFYCFIFGFMIASLTKAYHIHNLFRDLSASDLLNVINAEKVGAFIASIAGFFSALPFVVIIALGCSYFKVKVSLIYLFALMSALNFGNFLITRIIISSNDAFYVDGFLVSIVFGMSIFIVLSYFIGSFIAKLATARLPAIP
ncbi:MAG: hypothetical protein J0I42_12040 [Bosea sp.]|uniref:hypothetical protein n=1 Tax=Bosea sp. (in: a-proteobacteria) TaxID=1871050 RepID=UPI001AD26B40|nr:hypothetical protein [Bosea sp. (in: a-proteobacteria)]MBN9452669.1 hypothetical protein [Bosea sp. (in: a-proteobacteria)]